MIVICPRHCRATTNTTRDMSDWRIMSRPGSPKMYTLFGRCCIEKLCYLCIKPVDTPIVIVNQKGQRRFRASSCKDAKLGVVLIGVAPLAERNVHAFRVSDVEHASRFLVLASGILKSPGRHMPTSVQYDTDLRASRSDFYEMLQGMIGAVARTVLD